MIALLGALIGVTMANGWSPVMIVDLSNTGRLTLTMFIPFKHIVNLCAVAGGISHVIVM